jgi:protein-S-isoprenylcysteine O-methyltransferase Ste14
MEKDNAKHWLKSIVSRSAIIVYFIMAFEVMIMISPFAFFFYSVFAPLFNFLGQYPATSWTTRFFLPHMILPPTLFLQTVRVLGSVLFVLGFVTFMVCALQVYLGKIFKWGIAARGLYRYIRHPQYLALGVWGVGMAILWPRFIVLATLSLMFILYVFLAEDEERRMLKQYGESYRRYMDNTGRFLPWALERLFPRLGNIQAPLKPLKYVAIPLLIVTIVLGSGFLLRMATISSLPLETRRNITVVPILPEDKALGKEVLSGILKNAASGNISFIQDDKQYLAYLMPVDYVMQGMIADTGGQFHLFKKHHTLILITDWVLHPFEHLRRPPAAHMAAMHGMDAHMARRQDCPIQIDRSDLDCATCTYRRVILVEVEQTNGQSHPGPELLSLNAHRVPVGFIDINAQDGDMVKASGVQKGTAWKDVPTPEI